MDDEQGTGQAPSATEQALRAAAIKRLQDQRGFWGVLGVFVIVWGILTAIWALAGGGYFWPAWPILGMGIALAFIALGAYGPGRGPIPEERIEREVRRLRGA